MEEFGARIVASTYFKNVYFYYKYRLCIRVNLEIEGAETRVKKGNNKTRVCIEFEG